MKTKTKEEKRETKRQYEAQYSKRPDRMAYQRKYRRDHDKTEDAHIKRRIWDNRYRKSPDFKAKEKARRAARRNIPVVECLLCGSREKLERHHDDYSKPLEVMILCRSCHLQREGKTTDVMP